MYIPDSVYIQYIEGKTVHQPVVTKLMSQISVVKSAILKVQSHEILHFKGYKFKSVLSVRPLMVFKFIYFVVL
jgi:hypothetical protein